MGRPANFARVLAVVVALTAGGCVHPFDGSHIDFDLIKVTPLCEQIVASNMSLPGCTKGDTTSYYLELWAVFSNSALVRVLTFTVQPVVKPEELLELEQQGAVLSNGDPYLVHPPNTIEQSKANGTYDALYKDMVKLSTVYGITSYASTKFVEDPATKTPTKRLAAEYYVGNDLPVVLPRNGRLLGTVDGSLPFGAGVGRTGGASADVNIVLDRVSDLFITVESKPPDRSNPMPSTAILMDGRPTSVLRGVTTFEMSSPTSTASGVFNISVNLDDRSYF